MKTALKGVLVGLGIVALALPAAAQRYGSEAVLFKDPGFRGASIVIDGPVENLTYARFNDTISSVELSGAWELCVDPNFRGRCEVIDGPVASLSNFRLNDNISSVRPLNGRRANHDRRQTRDYGRGNDRDYGRGRGDGAVTLFKDPDFRGGALGLDSAVRNLREIGFNDTASSIKVRSGTWLICEHPDFRGRCEVIDGSVYRLSNLRMNDNISSIKRYRGGRAEYGLQSRDAGYGGINSYGDYGYGRDQGQYGRQSVQFDNPRDAYGRRILYERGNARAYCREQGFSQVVEVEASGRYIGCVVCAR